MRILSLVVILLFCGILILVPGDYAFYLSILLLIAGAFTYATISKDEGNSARWIFIAIFFLIAGVIASVSVAYLQQNIQSSAYPAMVIIRVFSVALGSIISLIATFLFFLLTAFVASIYVLSLQTVEGITVWQAFRSFIPTVLNTQYDWMVVSDGQIKKTREKGVMKWLGGPGKIIVEPGNAVVLQRGGQFTRVCGPGVHLTKRFEMIREVFDLRPHFKVSLVENVITKDRIPLTIELGMGYRIKPAEDLNSPTVIKAKENLFPVEKDTLMSAAFNNTAGKWSGLGAGAPVAQLHDQIMSYTLDELFELIPGTEPSPNNRMINQIEMDILDTLNGFAANNGLLFTVVDIRQITLPLKVKEAMIEAQATKLVEDQRNDAKKELIEDLLDTIQERRGEIGEGEIRLVHDFVERTTHIDMLRKMADSDGTKIINASNSPIEHPIEA